MTIYKSELEVGDIPSKLVAIGLIFYYLIPHAIPFFHFSPHVLFFGAAFTILLLQEKWSFTAHVKQNLIIILLGGLFFFSMLWALGNQPEIDYLRAWALSLMTFFIVSRTFHIFTLKKIRASVFIMLSIWSAACIVQVSFRCENFFEWFGITPDIIYATGLSRFSNHGAVIMVPMLIMTLTYNLEKINWWCCLVWMFGCAALYFTLSRAGWLALIFAIFVMSFRYRRNLIKLRNITLHATLCLLIIFLAWSIPTKVDSYELQGDQSGGRWALNSSDDYSAATRFITLKVAAKAVYEYPLTGLGVGAFPSYYSEHARQFAEGGKIDPRAKMTPHNGYAQLVAEVGLPVFIAFAIWLCWVISRLSMVLDQTAVGIHASIAGVLIWMIFHDGFYERHLWILLGIAVATTSSRSSILRAT